LIEYRQLLFDQLTPISIYNKLKKRFPDELSFLFESAISSEDGNFSFIFIGANERISYKAGVTTHTDTDAKIKTLDISPFEFLKFGFVRDSRPFSPRSSRPSAFPF